MEGILLPFIVELLDILEELVFSSDFRVILVMVDHLDKVMRQSIKVDLFGAWTPSEVIMRNLVVTKLLPKVRSCLSHHSFH